jgi:signal transduction histidine kinase
MDNRRIRVLLVEDDEDDYLLTHDWLAEVGSARYDLDWVDTYEAGLEAIGRGEHAVYLVDYRLGARDGLDLLREALAQGCRAPLIVLTGQGDYQVDVAAMQAGAADYLVKGQINASLLDRSLRYALERQRGEEALERSRQQLRDLATHLQSAREEECTRIAQMVHDELGQMLTALQFDLVYLENNLSRPLPPLREKIQAMSRLVEAALQTARQLTAELRPVLLEDFGLEAALEWQAQEFEKRTNIRCKLTLGTLESAVDLGRATAVYRIFQEALTNVARHAQAGRVCIRLHEAAGEVVLEVRDNGQGISEERLRHGKSLGLLGMKERALAWNGEVTVQGNPGKGTLVRARIPLEGEGKLSDA